MLWEAMIGQLMKVLLFSSSHHANNPQKLGQAKLMT